MWQWWNLIFIFTARQFDKHRRSAKVDRYVDPLNTDSREMWACVRRLTGKNQNFDRVEGITAESLNDHYSQISTDRDYTPPHLSYSMTSSLLDPQAQLPQL